MTQQACDLTKKHCVPCEGGVPPLSFDEVKLHLQTLSDWKLNDNKTLITRVFTFQNFHETMAFVNAIAWVSHQENHHPDLEVGYNRCVVNYMTHAVKGLTENDFICAAKVEALLKI
jgi:4a-hydroxytetrahydrobiopterin dehydratase